MEQEGEYPRKYFGPLDERGKPVFSEAVKPIGKTQFVNIKIFYKDNLIIKRYIENKDLSSYEVIVNYLWDGQDFYDKDEWFKILPKKVKSEVIWILDEI